MLTLDAESRQATGGDTQSAILRLEARLAALEASVARLHARQALERHGDAVLARYPAVDHAGLAASVAIPASGFIDAGDGFYSLEHGADGQAFRWTGPTAKPRVTVWVDRSRPMQVAVSFVALGRSAVDAPLEITVDGVAYPLRPVPSGLRRQAGPIPPRPQAGPTEIALLTPTMFSPQQEGLADTRVLGFAVHEIAVAPAA